MSTKSLYLNIHNLIHVWAPNIPQNVSNYLRSQLGIFPVCSDNKPEEIDIHLIQLQEAPKLASSVNRWNSLYGFCLSEYEKQQAVIFNYKGTPDVIVTFSEVIKILYINRPRVSNRLYGILLFCFKLVLNKKNGLLFHGAIAKKEDNSVLLIGHRGTKKTLLLLTMLREEWDYLSDDKFVLHDNNAYSFQPFIKIMNYHFDLLPWLDEIKPGIRRPKNWAFRKRIGDLAQMHVHKYLLPAVDKYCNPSLDIKVDTLFPACKILHSVKPSTVIVLFIGPGFSFTNVSKKEAVVDEIALIQQLAFQDMNSFENLLALHNSKFRYDIKEIVADNMNGQRFYKLVIPDNYDIDRAYQEVSHCLKQVL